MKSLWPWACAILSGLLLGLGYEPFNQAGLIWVALTPLISAIWFAPAAKREWLRSALLGYVTGLVYFGVSLFWITAVTVPGWAVFPFYLALYPALWGAFLGTILRPRANADGQMPWLSSAANLRLSFLGAAAWTATEWLRATLLSGFSWNGLGIALHSNVAMIQITEFTGVGGLSLLIVLVNLILVLTVRRLRSEIGVGKVLRPHYDFAICIGLVALCFSFGVGELMKTPPPEFPISVAAVQANIPQDQKWDAELDEFILKTYEDQTQIALAANPDLIVWPESATPHPLFLHQEVKRRVLQLASEFSGDFLLGTVNYDSSGDYNSAVLLSEAGARVQIYNKMHLVAFGEYLPFRESFPIFVWLVGDQVPADFDAGKEPVLLTMEKGPVRIAPLICFEDTLGPLARLSALQGAQLFVTITNDGWFLKTAGSAQHVAHAIFRSAESKLPMVRSANTGVTCFIDRFGRVTSRLASESGDTFIQGVLMGQVLVPRDPIPTFYTRYGEAFSIACLGVSLLVMATFFARRRFFA